MNFDKPLVSRAKHFLDWLAPIRADPAARQHLQSRAHLQPFREQVLTGLLRIGAMLGTLALLISSIPPLLDAPGSVLFIDAGILVAIWVVALWRDLDYLLRAGTLVIGLYLISGIEIIYYGLSQDAAILFLFCSLLSMLFFDRRVGAVVLTLSVATLASVGTLISIQHFTPLAHPIAELSLSTMITTCLIFLMIGGSVQTGVALLLDHLDLLWQRERCARQLLEEERDLLEQRVAQRTAELAQAHDQVVVALHAAAAQNAELEAFAHTVAHDLKSPLTIMVGHSQMILKYQTLLTPKEVTESLHAINRGGRKMGAIINELLLLARVRTLDAIPRTEFAMDEIIREVESRLQTEITTSDAQIIYPACWPSVLGYGPWVEEVWINYMSNAIKYGGAPPIIELGAAPGPPGFVRFWVRDNGPGLSSEQQALLFTPFTRLHTMRAEGHGLGLSIVQRIIERLGGSVGVESSSGQGATFFFTLPAMDPRV
ncbi:MAG: HAMP domain-containing histidine kinase [Oscillochloris sp.]|nr:HAMP domain-containing histidine kinase [Oscillochloris sp.]